MTLGNSVLKLRLACTSDASDLTGILHRGKGSWGYSENMMAEYREHWSISETDISEMTFVIAEKDGVPAAFLGCSEKDEATLCVDYLFVDPAFQRQGIGDLLLLRAEDLARKLGLQKLYLESDVHAENFYGRRGFRVLSRRLSQMVPGGGLPMMEKALSPVVHKLEGTSIQLDQAAPWAFEVKNKLEIGRHWKDVMDENQQLWDGRNLILADYEFAAGILTGSCKETAFSSFLAWRDWGFPDSTVANVFGSAVLVSSDGALVFGVMSEHTANAGKIYPPGGNLDLQDVRADGSVDFKAAIYRELEEETGLKRSDVRELDMLIAFEGPRICIAQIFQVDQVAEKLAKRIRDFSLATEERELSDMRIIRENSDLHDPMIVPYAREIGKYLFARSVA